MSTKFKMFNGIDWFNICDCNVYAKTIVNWSLLDPVNSTIKYWNGSTWNQIVCCICPEGYTYDFVNRECTKIDVIPATPASGSTTYPIVLGVDSTAYGSASTRLYKDITNKRFPLNAWQNTSISFSSAAGYQVYDNAGAGVITTVQAVSVPGNVVFSNAAQTNTNGRLNEIGIWATDYPVNQWLTVEFCINISVTKTYIFAIAGDNQVKAGITSTTFNGGVTNFNLVNLWGSNSPTGIPTDSSYPNSFKVWHMFPITLPAGVHTLQLSGMDFGTPAAFGAEIYDISESDMMTLMANPSLTIADLEPYILFTTKSLVTTPPLIVGAPGAPVLWTCPSDYTLSGCFGVLSCTKELVAPCESSD